MLTNALTASSATYQDSLDVAATTGGNTHLSVSNPGNITAGNSGNVVFTADGSPFATNALSSVTSTSAVATAHGGSLQAQIGPAGGAVLTMRLPLKTTHEPR